LDQVRMLLADLPSPKDVFHYIWGCSDELHVKIVTLLWVLTSERNAVNASERMKTTEKVAMQIQRFYMELREFFKKRSVMSSCVRTSLKNNRGVSTKILLEDS
jgi:hypothetical protein